MKCEYCGAELPDGSKYCGKCGNRLMKTVLMVCPRCGKPINENEFICSRCGEDLTPKRSDSPSTSNKMMIILIIIAAVFAVIAVSAVTFISFNMIHNKNVQTIEVTDSPAAIATAAPTEQNVITQLPADYITQPQPPPNHPDPVMPPQPHEQTTPPPAATEKTVSPPAETYTRYNSSKYNFSCAYPTSFHTTNIPNAFILYSCESPDSSAELRINGKENSTGLSPQKVFDNFLSTNGGTVDFQNVGSDFCAGRSINGSRTHYCYYKLTNGMLRGFELHYPTAQQDYYDIMVNEIYASISFY